VRFFYSSFAIVAGLMLASIGTAEAVTYGPVTLSVPVSVNAPMSVAGNYVIQVLCSSPKTATFSGIADTTSQYVAVSTGRVTFGPAPISVPLSAGLQSGATVTCSMTVTPPASTSLQQYLSGLTYDSSKMTTQIVLP
jgi:hypothetical protein